jgi:aminoglycoside phosphotransferase
MKSYILCFVFKGISLFVTMRGSYGPVTALPFGLILKSSKLEAPEEAKTIQFVQRNTQIPVPRIIVSATGIWNHYMLMKRVDGELLHSTWNRLSQQQQSHVVDQLRLMVEQLRSLPPPQPSSVSALNNAPCLDARVAGSRTFGPFTTVAEFHDHLADVSTFYMDEADIKRIRARMSDHHRVLFTHGDLAPRNIFVKGDRVVALIDWEHSGWYPEYWEYVKAKYCHMLDTSWDEAISRIIPQNYEDDFNLDKQLSDPMVGPI